MQNFPPAVLHACASNISKISMNTGRSFLTRHSTACVTDSWANSNAIIEESSKNQAALLFETIIEFPLFV